MIDEVFFNTVTNTVCYNCEEVRNGHMLKIEPSRRVWNWMELIDLVRRFPTTIWSQRSASVEPRTDRSKIEIEVRRRKGVGVPNRVVQVTNELRHHLRLAAICGKSTLPRTEVTKKVWEYIKKNKTKMLTTSSSSPQSEELTNAFVKISICRKFDDMFDIFSAKFFKHFI